MSRKTTALYFYRFKLLTIQSCAESNMSRNSTVFSKHLKSSKVCRSTFPPVISFLISFTISRFLPFARSVPARELHFSFTSLRRFQSQLVPPSVTNYNPIKKPRLRPDADPSPLPTSSRRCQPMWSNVSFDYRGQLASRSAFVRLGRLLRGAVTE